MTRRFACFTVVFLSCCALYAQAPAPAAPAAPAAPLASGVTTTASAEVQEFQKVEDTWSNAVNTRDQYSLEFVLSPLFVDIAADGTISTRNQQLASVITGEDKTVQLSQHVITVRMLGDTAIVNGTYTLHHRVGSRETDERGIFTHVFERQHGNWKCVNAQRTVLRQDEPDAKKKRKPSTAEEPFHIPFFTKGSGGSDQ